VPDDAMVAAFVATLDRAHFFKRLDVAIEALATASAPLHMLVAGGGEWLERYREHAAAAGLGDRVHFVGRVGHDRLPDLLRASDFLLLTSDLESFGMVLIEAMACGKPVVATDLPGPRAVVADGSTGFVAPRGDVCAIAATLDRMVHLGAEGRRQMGLRGRAECERMYAWPKLVDRLEQIYAGALEEARR
jgi:glycosyltransferase involved in cell wall biosynthesis